MTDEKVLRWRVRFDGGTEFVTIAPDSTSAYLHAERMWFASVMGEKRLLNPETGEPYALNEIQQAMAQHYAPVGLVSRLIGNGLTKAALLDAVRDVSDDALLYGVVDNGVVGRAVDAESAPDGECFRHQGARHEMKKLSTEDVISGLDD